MNINYFKPFVGFAILLLTFSCSVSPEAINYGKDQCSFCVMNIVDKTHAAQYVTNKGKQFKFDAIECLVNDLKDKNMEDMAFVLVADFQNPGVMMDAQSASYVICPEIKSPMGANLSALSSIEKAEELLISHSGEIFSFETLKTRLADN